MLIRSWKMLLLALATAALLVGAPAGAQTEPTLKQIYAAAQSGHVDEAQQLLQRVLKDHPASAKAHYVAAELHARQAEYAAAREELATAEKLAPGLPFAKPEAVAALRAQLTPRSAAPASAVPVHAGVAAAAAAESATSGLPWGWILLLGAGGLFLFLQLRRQPAAAPMAYGGAMQPAAAGYGNAAAGGVGNPGYAAAPVPGAPTGGVGSGLMGGLATGLAVGAGVVAAQQIGSHLFGHGQSASPAAPGAAQAFTPIEPNTDMGGENFGVSNGDSWDDGGAVGGDDWDS